MSGQSSGQTPRASTSSRPSASPSSRTSTPAVANGSRISAPLLDDTKTKDGDQFLVINSDAAADYTVAGRSIRQDVRHGRQRPRSSGGFLLQTTPGPISQPSDLKNTDFDVTGDVKGKRKAEDGDLIVLKRASARQRHRLKTSVGSSPLATEVSNALSTEEEDSRKGPNPDKRSSIQTTANQSSRSAHSSNDPSTGPWAASESEKPHVQPSAIGHDTDPAQIVNLALNLSESRRRNFSSGGLLQPRDSIGSRRIISSGQHSSGLSNSGSGGSLGQYLRQQRQASRNVSPKSGRSASSKAARPPSAQKNLDGSRSSTWLPDFGAETSDDNVFDASDATLSRAEKARVTLELSYEYRRLLQYLPAIPTSPKTRSSAGKGTTKITSKPVEGLGRSYNPLQYIRNRKVRFRERRPLHSETDGSKDLERVRIWVDTVASERQYGISRVDDRFPLPDFETVQGDPSTLDSSRSPTASQPDGTHSKKPARPYMDWEFMPWDLLADARWLEEDENIKHIEDSSGNKIVNEHFNHKTDSPRTSKESTHGSVRRSESIVRHNSSPDRLAAKNRHDSNDRGRRRWEMHEPRSPTDTENGSPDRKGRWPKRLIRSRSSSSSDRSHSHKSNWYTRGHKYAGNRDHLDNAALEKQMMDMLAKEEEHSRGANKSSNDKVGVGTKADAIQNDNHLINGQFTGSAKRRPSAPQRMRTDIPTLEKHQKSPRASLDEQKLHHHRMSSDDFDSTAPSSPTVSGFIPSIAINLSPPASPPTSAMMQKKPFASRMGSFRRNRSRSINSRATSDVNIATGSQASAQISRQTTNDSHLRNRLQIERSADPSNGLLSPTRSEAMGSRLQPLESRSTRGTKDAPGPESKFRGLFKGGRIAEIVGNEISRVGDMFWRKDSSHEFSRVTPPGSSYASGESDLDDGDLSGLDSSAEDNLSRVSTNNGRMGRISRISTNSEKPKYYMKNLPSFRTRDEESPTSIRASPEQDPITLQQLQQRERGRSSRFDSLAPPKIDMRGISPSPSRSPSLVRTQTRATETEDSRQSSSSRSGRRVRSADRRLNRVLGIPGKVGTGEPAPTGLSAFESHPRASRERPNLGDKRQWSISDRGVSAVRGTITKRDIARVRALLLSSGVKANEIARRGNEIPNKASPFMQNLHDLFQGSIPLVPKSQEHLVAARMLIGKIETTTEQLKNAAESFPHGTMDRLHDQIRAVDDRVTYKLTPQVRASADDADAFSTELTTTCTLAVKQLNDSVDLILRRRRRKLRWIRRGGWAVLEWTLLGIMWMVWFIVVIVRLIRRTIGGFIQGLKWLFWL
ncbi:hypothetical protein MMC28_007110 [Mycoblastus sanguinarius]|nr:hypothetical protein [Mycoblastus sanguinarius]